MVSEKLINWEPLLTAYKSLNLKWRLVAIVSIIAITLEIYYFASNVIPWAKMGVAEWAYWVGAIGTITAVGVAIAVAAYQNASHDRRQASADEDAERGLLLGIRAELSISLGLVEDRVGQIIDSMEPGDIFDGIFPIAERLMPFYAAMLPNFHLIKDHKLRVQIIRTHTIANSLVSTFRANNDLVAEYVAASILAQRSESEVDTEIAVRRHVLLVDYAVGLRELYIQARTEIQDLLGVLPHE